MIQVDNLRKAFNIGRPNEFVAVDGVSLTIEAGGITAAGIWLIVNYADNQAVDYPLIKPKYILLIVLGPFIIGELILQANYFFALRPDVITSCCGSLFTSEAAGALGAVVALPRTSVQTAFYASMVAVFATGGYFYLRGRRGWLFAVACAIAFLTCVVALISFLSPYIYELPTHHCPFCLLQKEYRYVGYPLYLTLLVGAATGLGAGILGLFRKVSSLQQTLPRIRRRLVLTTLLCYSAFLMIVAYECLSSNLRM